MPSRCAAHTGLAFWGRIAHATARSVVTVLVPADSAKAAKSCRSRPSFPSLKPRARRIARAHLGTYLRLPNYRRSLARIGYGEDDLADAGSDRLVDAVVAWGPLEQATDRLRQHLEAGADHVAVQVLTEDRARLPLEEWRAIAGSNLFS